MLAAVFAGLALTLAVSAAPTGDLASRATVCTTLHVLGSSSDNFRRHTVGSGIRQRLERTLYCLINGERVMRRAAVIVRLLRRNQAVLSHGPRHFLGPEVRASKASRTFNKTAA